MNQVPRRKNVVIREKLQLITEVQDASKHPALLADLTGECPNSIRITESPHPIDRYTCLMHVLEFTEKPEYVAIARYGLRRIFAGTDFAHWLVERGHLVEVSQTEAQEGDLVLYFKDGQFKHAGLWQSDDRVLSKWGVGHLYDHEIFEIPMSYGTEVKFYNRLPYEEAFGFFQEFVEESGIQIGGHD